MAKKDTPKAQNDPAEPQNILVTNGVPPMLVRVKEGVSFSHEGQDYTEGQEVEIDGPVAQQFVLMGFVDIV
jgi:hypothetical protein